MKRRDIVKSALLIPPTVALCLIDCVRVGEYLDMPFRFAQPDPIVQNHYPFLDTNK